MQMNPNIILAGQQPDIMGAIDAGNTARARQDQFQHENAFRSMMQQQGPGIMQGDQNALAEFARFDAPGALGVQQTQLGMQVTREQLAQVRQGAAQAAQSAQSAQQVQQELAQARRMMAMGAAALQSGNEQQWNMVAAEFGFEGLPMDPQSIAIMEAAVDGLDTGLAAIMTPQQPEQTTGTREYEMARSQGYQGTFMDYQREIAEAKRAQTNVTTNVGGGQTPQLLGNTGIAAVPDPNEPSGWRMMNVPGGPAAQEEASLEAKGELRMENRARAGGTVIQDLQRALDLLPELGALGGMGGVPGATTRLARAKVPGTVENRIRQFTESALSNVGLDTLQAMREASPTGGALGQVPIQQQQRLEQVLGSLRLDQDPQDLEANLKRVMNIYTDIVYGSPSERRNAVESGRMTPQQSAEIEAMYQALPFDERGRRVAPQGGQQPAPAPAQGGGTNPFRDAPLDALMGMDVNSMSGEQLRAYNARMRELLANE
jgi:hypothetical protein